MNNTIGQIIKLKRLKMNVTRESLAKKLKITDGYMAHIERDDPVPISERIALGLKKILKADIMSLVPQQNVHAARYYRQRRRVNS